MVRITAYHPWATGREQRQQNYYRRPPIGNRTRKHHPPPFQPPPLPLQSRQYRSKNKVSEWRDDFEKHKGEILPAARGDAKWSGMAWRLPWWRISAEMVWGTMSWGWAGWGAERAHGLCAPF